MLADSKNSRTFASLLKTSTLEKEVWRDGRVVDCGGLENRCTARYRGFESLSLRQEVVNQMICNLFFFCNIPLKKRPHPKMQPLLIYYEK